MPTIKVNDITMNYDQQGTGEPLLLIPYLAIDYACYAFQVAEYAKHFTCISVDLRGTGETDKPAGTYSTELFADDVAAFMQALGIQTLIVTNAAGGVNPHYRAGDLMLFAEPGHSISHVAIYAGDGVIIHASSSVGGVGYTDLNSGGDWFVAYFVAARRVL